MTALCLRSRHTPVSNSATAIAYGMKTFSLSPSVIEDYQRDGAVVIRRRT